MLKKKDRKYRLYGLALMMVSGAIMIACLLLTLFMGGLICQ